MSIPSGLAAQIGYGQEVTWGTGVTVDRFVPLTSESLSQEIDRLESSGIIAGARVLRTHQWAAGNVTIAGDVTHDVFDRSIGRLFTNAFGSVVTTGSGPYTHTFKPGDLTGKGLTVQVGRPDTGGTVRPFTYAGCKVASWEVGCSAGEIATLSMSLVGKSETTATAMAASSDAGARPFTFVGGSVLIGGATPAAVKVRKFSITGDNGLDTDRRNIGDAQIDQPLEKSLRSYGGTLDLEFTSLDAYSNFTTASEWTVICTLVAGAASLSFGMNVRFDGATPNVGGAELLTISQPFKCVAPQTSDDGAITATYITTNSTP